MSVPLSKETEKYRNTVVEMVAVGVFGVAVVLVVAESVDFLTNLLCLMAANVIAISEVQMLCCKRVNVHER